MPVYNFVTIRATFTRPTSPIPDPADFPKCASSPHASRHSRVRVPPPLAPARRTDAEGSNDEGTDADRVIQAYLARSGTAGKDAAGVLGPRNPMIPDARARLLAFACDRIHR